MLGTSAEQRISEVSEEKLGSDVYFAFLPCFKCISFFRWRLFETGMKYTEDEGLRDLLKTIKKIKYFSV